MSKYYKIERFIFVSPRGVRKFWEVTPIVAIVTFVLTTASTYFTLYYPVTRTNVAYTKDPIYSQINLMNPIHCRAFDINCYSNYKPMVEVNNALKEMKCEEWKRFRELKKKNIKVKTLQRFNIYKPTETCK